MDKKTKSLEIIFDLVDGRLPAQMDVESESKKIALDDALDLLSNDDDARLTWRAWHLSADVLQQSQTAQTSLHNENHAIESIDLSSDFVARFRKRLEQKESIDAANSIHSADLKNTIKHENPLEPSIHTATIFRANKPSILKIAAEITQKSAANQSTFYRRFAAALASFAIVALSWNLWNASQDSNSKSVDLASHSALANQNQNQNANSNLNTNSNFNSNLNLDSFDNDSNDSSNSNVMLRDPHLDALLAAHQQANVNSAWQAPAGFLRNATFEGSNR